MSAVPSIVEHLADLEAELVARAIDSEILGGLVLDLNLAGFDRGGSVDAIHLVDYFLELWRERPEHRAHLLKLEVDDPATVGVPVITRAGFAVARLDMMRRLAKWSAKGDQPGGEKGMRTRAEVLTLIGHARGVVRRLEQGVVRLEGRDGEVIARELILALEGAEDVILATPEADPEARRIADQLISTVAAYSSSRDNSAVPISLGQLRDFAQLARKLVRQ